WPYGDGTGRRADYSGGTHAFTLYRDGTEIGTGDRFGGLFPVPPERGTYQLVSTAARDGLNPMSVRVGSTSTFPSSHVDVDAFAPLPLLTVHVNPELDQYNRAKAGRKVTIPITVRTQPDLPAKVKTLTVDVSFDDGATWHPTKVKPAGPNWSITVDNP